MEMTRTKMVIQRVWDSISIHMCLYKRTGELKIVNERISQIPIPIFQKHVQTKLLTYTYRWLLEHGVYKLRISCATTFSFHSSILQLHTFGLGNKPEAIQIVVFLG